MKTLLAATFLSVLLISMARGQEISSKVPENIDSTHTYLFYLHGGVVQQQGVNAVSQYYGAYHYLAILDTLSSHGFHVISEVRPKHTDEAEYAEILTQQIDRLLQQDVNPEHIIIVGASLGAYITLELASKLKNGQIKYAILGLCSEYALEYFSDYGKNLHGNFLSIYESSDSKGSCESIFRNIPPESAFQEIELNMGIDHAFLYKPYDEWVLTVVTWINGS